MTYCGFEYRRKARFLRQHKVRAEGGAIRQGVQKEIWTGKQADGGVIIASHVIVQRPEAGS